MNTTDAGTPTLYRKHNKILLPSNFYHTKLSSEKFNVESVDVSLEKLGATQYGSAVLVLTDNEEDAFDLETILVSQIDQYNILIVEDSLPKPAPEPPFPVVWSYHDALRPWYNESDPDPFGSIIRMRPNWVVLHNSGMKAMFFRWEAVNQGHNVVSSFVKPVSQQAFNDNPKEELDKVLSVFNQHPAAGYLSFLEGATVHVVVGTVENYDVYKIVW